MTKDDLINEVIDKYGEWLETAGDRCDELMIDILAQMVINERDSNEFLEKVAYARIKTK